MDEHTQKGKHGGGGQIHGATHIWRDTHMGGTYT